MNTRTLILVLSLFSPTMCGSVELIKVAHFKTEESNRNVFSTPIAYSKGYVYTVNIEENPDSSRYKNTVVRKYDVSGEDKLISITVIDGKTRPNIYHTQGSIALDKEGFVHVAYNMHNDPWQYSVSKQADSIAAFEFKGSSLDSDIVTLGSGAIGGNQVTYPGFYKDRKGDLFVSFRYAVRPARAFIDRAFGIGISQYDVLNKKWNSLGQKPALEAGDFLGNQGSVPMNSVAYTPGMTAYFPRLHFDINNHLHIAWTWRVGKAGRDTQSLHYLHSKDLKTFYDYRGSRVELPVKYDNSRTSLPDKFAPYYAYLSIWSDRIAQPSVLYHSIEDGRKIIDIESDTIGVPQNSPHSSSQVAGTDKNEVYAFATGPKIFERQKSNWEQVYKSSKDSAQLCDIKVITDYESRQFLLHSKLCKANEVMLHRIPWGE